MKDDLLPFYKERAFTLNTTPERFATWLQKHVKAGLVTPPGAKIHVGIVQFTPPPNIGPTARLKIHGYVEKPDPEEDGAYLRSHLPGLIQFELVPSLTIEGVEVRAECYDPALIEYFDELLAKIERSATLTLTRGSADDKRFGEILTGRGNMDWDVFISHAWEDKEDIARPLAEALRRKGLRVWYDEFTLTLGDSLRRSIDRGLGQSRYGVVILSRHFFAKEWPQKELDGLAAREVGSGKVILPVWHNVIWEDVRRFSPTLADKLAVSTAKGLDAVVEEILQVIPEAVSRAVTEEVKAPLKPELHPSLDVKLSVRPQTMDAGGEATWTVTLRNDGDDDLRHVTVRRGWRLLDEPFDLAVSEGRHFTFTITYKTAGEKNEKVTVTGIASDGESVRDEASATVQVRPPPPDVLTITAPIYLELVRVPAGEFLMGSDLAKDELAEDNEQPQHRVYAFEFYIGKYPVTNVQYEIFVRATKHEAPAHWKRFFWQARVPSGKENHPVVNVSWNDAVAFCKWLSRETGKAFRLPTEAEWEKAARGTDGRKWPWGNQPPDDKRLDFNNIIILEIDSVEVDYTTSVGQYSPAGDSPYGAADMTGNVWEWTQSLGKGYPYDPTDGREDLKAKGPRVLRGGSTYLYPDIDNNLLLWLPRCASRSKSPPDIRKQVYGFRVCVVSRQD